MQEHLLIYTSYQYNTLSNFFKFASWIGRKWHFIVVHISYDENRSCSLHVENDLEEVRVKSGRPVRSSCSKARRKWLWYGSGDGGRGRCTTYSVQGALRGFGQTLDEEERERSAKDDSQVFE